MNDLALRDIHLPDAVSMWPLAIGWWLLPLLIALVAFGIVQFLKIKKQNREIAYRDISLLEFKKIRTQFINDNNSRALLRAISALLRRIALSYLPREQIASLTGDQWVQQLNILSSQHIFDDRLTALLVQGPYQAHNDFDHQQLLTACEQWIELLPKTKNTELNFSNIIIEPNATKDTQKITGAAS